jgi:hypothetical protein
MGKRWRWERIARDRLPANGCALDAVALKPRRRLAESAAISSSTSRSACQWTPELIGCLDGLNVTGRDAKVNESVPPCEAKVPRSW